MHHILSVVASPACSLELRNSMLSLACVGVRTQSSVFLSLEEKETPGRNFIARCISVIEECLTHIKAGEEKNKPHQTTNQPNTQEKTADGDSETSQRWIAQSVPLLWNTIHLLGEIVNTLFVDYEHLQQVWYLLIQVV